jgi:hypothetical protein
LKAEVRAWQIDMMAMSQQPHVRRFIAAVFA